MNVELTDKQIKELVKIICNTKLGTLKELMQLTSYDIIELDYIRENYPEIKKAIEVKEKAVTENLLQIGMESVNNSFTRRDGILTKSDVEVMKVILDGVGKSKGYGKQESSISINNSNNVLLELSDEELEMELQTLDDLSNNDSLATDKPKSYLQVSNTDDKNHTT